MAKTDWDNDNFFPDQVKGDSSLIKIDKEAKKMNFKGIKNSLTMYAFDNPEGKEFKVVPKPSMVI